MKKILRLSVIVVVLFSILTLPVAVPSSAAATTTITNGWFYVIQNVHSGKFLEVANGNVVVGANVWQDVFNFDNSLSQLFYMYSAEEGSHYTQYHQLLPAGDVTLCVDVDNAADIDGANIKIFSENPGYGAQHFWFENAGDGSFYIHPEMSTTRVFGVANNSSANQANVQLVTKNPNQPSQRWILKKVSPGTDPDYIEMNWSYFFHSADATENMHITQRFANTNEDDHYGIDISADTGTPIYSPCSGTVIMYGTDPTMGKYVILRTTPSNEDEPLLTIRLMHMNELGNITTGQTVSTNTLLGTVGNTGNSDGPHLHVDVNNKNYHSGWQIRADLSSMIHPEKFYLQMQFTYNDNLDNVVRALPYPW